MRLRYLPLIATLATSCFCPQEIERYDIPQAACIDRIEGDIVCLITEDLNSSYLDLSNIKADRPLKEGDCLDILYSPDGIRIYYDGRKTEELKRDIEYIIDQLQRPNANAAPH